MSEPINNNNHSHEATATLEETLNGLQKVSDMLQASLKDLEGDEAEQWVVVQGVSSLCDILWRLIIVVIILCSLGALEMTIDQGILTFIKIVGA